MVFFFFFKQKTAYEMRISDWSSDVCSSDLDCIVSTLRLVHRQRALVVGCNAVGGQHIDLRESQRQACILAVARSLTTWRITEVDACRIDQKRTCAGTGASRHSRRRSLRCTRPDQVACTQRGYRVGGTLSINRRGDRKSVV